MTDRKVERLGKLSTATVSDALDRLRVPGQCHGIVAAVPGARIAGRAYTVRYETASSQTRTVGDYIDDVPPGHVVVLDNRAREDASVWGELLSSCARARGIAGTIIDGIHRDSASCSELDYPVFSRGHWMRTGKDRVQVAEFNELVNIGGVRVSPGDLIVADDDGVIAIPRVCEESVLQAAEEIHSLELRIRNAVLEGMRLADARRIFGYFVLQRGETI